MNSVDKQYKELLQRILTKGRVKKDRTGTGTISVFGHTMRFDMSEGFPLLTSKKMFTKGIIHELIWFLRGSTRGDELVKDGCNIWVGDMYANYLKYPLATIQDYRTNILYQNIDKGWCVRNGRSMVSPHPTRHLTKEEFINKIKTDDEFAKKWGELGPIYGHQWRKWNGIDKDAFFNSDNLDEGNKDARHGMFYKESEIDQIQNLINDLKTNPDSRRLIVSAYNVGQLDQMVLPPCHIFFQCYTYEMTEEERIREWCNKLGKDISYGEYLDNQKLDELGFPKRKLSLEWYQRSVDVGLGLGFNIASYGLLLHLLAKEVNMIPDELIFTGGDCHIYLNHIEGLKKQLNQESYPLPTLKLNNSTLDELKYEDIEIVGYKSSPSIKLELSN